MCLQKKTRELHPEAAIPNRLHGKELREEAGDGAASALHGGVTESRDSSLIDDELGTVIAAWATLPAVARRGILAIIAVVRGPDRDQSP